jgi:hypothetical protein
MLSVGEAADMATTRGTVLMTTLLVKGIDEETGKDSI